MSLKAGMRLFAQNSSCEVAAARVGLSAGYSFELADCDTQNSLPSGSASVTQV